MRLALGSILRGLVRPSRPAVGPAPVAAPVEAAVAPPKPTTDVVGPPAPPLAYVPANGKVDKATQILLSLRYRDMLRRGDPLPTLAETEFSAFSQHGDDGVLLYLFSLLGTTNKKAVEVCAGDCVECNAANLVVNHGWKALQLDGDPANIARGNAFYDSRRDGLLFLRPRMVQSWITADTVDGLIRSNGFAGDIDLLSIDIDGVDYWIWKAIECVRPRVVVVEYNPAAGGERAYALPYQPDYVANWVEAFGASLPALEKLGREKGYRLVGTLGFGINAFFVRDDLGRDVLPTLRASDAVYYHFRKPGAAFARWVDV